MTDCQSSSGKLITILMADDHSLVREGILFGISRTTDMTVVAEASNGQEAIDMFELHRPDITLLDLRMPGVSGLDALLAIRRIAPTARVIIITTFPGDVQASRALRAGAAGYLLKGTMRKELTDTIRRVHAGERRIPYEVAATLADYAGSEPLSPREIEVLRHAAAGSSNKRIGVGLGITEETVKGHMRNILSKLEANDRTHAVTIALKRGFLDG
ncbi:response regulator [Granulicella sibirica]|uniref:response regulator n=1 Tax=Granulicella sibirica TaxID=2479048 RepID=UPI00100874E2|nr:response regulator transcription factor [Granulicella sibirica]